MSIRRLIPYLSAIVLLILYVSASAKPVLDIQYWHTKSGTPVYFVPSNGLPILDIQVGFAAGSSQDDKNFGLAQMTNALLDQGSDALSADQIADQFAAVGANFNSSVNRDFALVGMRTLTKPQLMNTALTTFITVLSQPSFQRGAFDRIRNQMLSAIDQEDQDPSAIAQKAFFKAVYKDQPYGHSVLGTSNSLAMLSPAIVKRFYKQYYVSRNSFIAIVGAINRSQAEQITEKITEVLPTGTAAPSLALASPTAKALVDYIDYPSQQTTLLLGQVGINPKSADFFPLLVGNYTLGGGMLVSRLINELREKRGLVYRASSGFYPMAANGPFVITLQTRNAKADAALKITQQTLDTFLKQGPTADELKAAKENMLGGFPLSLASNTGILNQLVLIAFYHLPLNYLDTYRANVAAVTSTQIQSAFQKLINPSAQTIIRVGAQNNKIANAD